MKPDRLPRSEWIARVAEWNGNKGFGWLQWADKRLFFHVRDYDDPRRQPRVGEEVRFVLGTDHQGRPCARGVRPAKGGHRISLINWAVWVVLLILPAMALQDLRSGGKGVAIAMIVFSLIAYLAYASDKKRARTNTWRIPELQMHLLELLGGWPGAWLAQKRFRHKCSKVSYQFIFWCIVLAYEAAACDSLQNWRLVRLLIDQAQRH